MPYKDIRVRHHCHITDEYRSSVHQIFNTNFRMIKKDTCHIS